MRVPVCLLPRSRSTHPTHPFGVCLSDYVPAFYLWHHEPYCFIQFQHLAVPILGFLISLDLLSTFQMDVERRRRYGWRQWQQQQRQWGVCEKFDTAIYTSWFTTSLIAKHISYMPFVRWNFNFPSIQIEYRQAGWHAEAGNARATSNNMRKRVFGFHDEFK